MLRCPKTNEAAAAFKSKTKKQTREHLPWSKMN